jgi:phage terminase Nu1 subunit (DNA packaging protein)
MEDTDPARLVKPKLRLRLGEHCDRSDLMSAFGVDKNTVAAWNKAGLVPCNAATAEDVYFVDDVFAFLKKFPVNDADAEKGRQEIRELRRRPKRARRKPK